MGSLSTALGSFLQAKKQKGKWLVRIDDLDPPREIKGASATILKTLECFGLYWDEEVVYQSQRVEYYDYALSQLDQMSTLFNCGCSRKQIKELAVTGPIGLIYPGTCRDKNVSKSPFAVRLKIDNEQLCFDDLLQGHYCQKLSTDIGDVTLKRADGYFAYHLAVVVDDYLQNITEIVRGIDLIECTPIHIYLQHMLDYPTPQYMHLPIIVNETNQKLSKQTKAKEVDCRKTEDTLFKLLNLLKQDPPHALQYETRDTILNWGIDHWDLKKITGKTISPG